MTCPLWRLRLLSDQGMRFDARELKVNAATCLAAEHPTLARSQPTACDAGEQSSEIEAKLTAGAVSVAASDAQHSQLSSPSPTTSGDSLVIGGQQVQRAGCHACLPSSRGLSTGACVHVQQAQLHGLLSLPVASCSSSANPGACDLYCIEHLPGHVVQVPAGTPVF